MKFNLAIAMLLASPLALAAPNTPVEGNILEERGCATGITAARAAQVKSAFHKAKIVPDLIPSISPKLDMTFTYGGKKVDLGKPILKTSQTIMEPEVTISGLRGKHNKKYSVFLIDPDVPMRSGSPVKVTFLHWYFAHVKASKCGKSALDTVTLYELPTPGSMTQHRYTFLVYEEPEGYKPNMITAQQRPGFQIADYIKDTGLVLVGGNYFLEAITNDVTGGGKE